MLMVYLFYLMYWGFVQMDAKVLGKNWDTWDSYRRTHVINYFILKYGYKTYLEIGVNRPQKNFDHILVDKNKKVSVDTNGYGTYTMTSDKFFEMVEVETPKMRWDVIFVDGYHHKDQVYKDIQNSLKYINEDGVIFCHDVCPLEEWLLDKKFCWNAWEAFARIRTERSDIAQFTVPLDHLGFIIPGGSQKLYTKPIEYTWDYLERNRKELLNLLTEDEFFQLFGDDE